MRQKHQNDRKVYKLCENYLQKTKVVNVFLISAQLGCKVGNHTQYQGVNLLRVGNKKNPVPIFRVFTQPVYVAAV